MTEDCDNQSPLPFKDARRLELRELVADMDPTAYHRVVLVCKPSGDMQGDVGILPGSFNPPTNAHVALATSGRQAGLSCVLYLLSKRTIDKERVSGIDLADRLAVLEQVAGPQGDGVAFTNCGLYVDQALALRNILPPPTRIAFLVGFDKIVQILDERYYENRDEALDMLFSIATFMVAPREATNPGDLRTLIESPANQRYSDRIRSIPLASEYRDLSSTHVRNGTSDAVPPVVRDYLNRSRPFDVNAH